MSDFSAIPDVHQSAAASRPPGMLADASAPAVLPPIGAGPMPILPQYQPLLIGETNGEFGVFDANGHTCRVPKIVNISKIRAFFGGCPPAKFLNDQNPECSCKAFISQMDDFGILTTKIGGQYYTAYGTGIGYPIMLVILALIVFGTIGAPIIYFISYRMSRSEIQATKNPEFFFQWHARRLSGLFALVLFCAGFALFFLSLAGTSEIELLGLRLSTNYPGLVMVAFGFLIWWRILSGTLRVVKAAPSGGG
ncbi:hypothetical protein [Rhizobium sp. ZPR3]|uniref:Uncharacterized protein n=2 Tax=unclassified Rhizobium TaxID=2613769 RepID=A0AAU7SEY2_9HYPH